MLEVKGVTKRYGNMTVLKDVSFNLDDSERLSIRGESGCGKTSLLMIIAGLLPCDSGKIIFDGKLPDREPYKREISMVFQESLLWNNMTVRENILFSSALKDKRERKEMSDKLAEDFGIADLLSRYPYEISGGQSRRAAIARALAAQRRVLLLDEPFSSLDKEWKERTMEKLKELCGKDCSVLLVTHSKEEADYFCDRHLQMEEGKLS